MTTNNFLSLPPFFYDFLLCEPMNIKIQKPTVKLTLSKKAKFKLVIEIETIITCTKTIDNQPAPNAYNRDENEKYRRRNETWLVIQ
jgi:hypothetical protein